MYTVEVTDNFFGAFNAEWQIALNQQILADFSRQRTSHAPLTKAQSDSHFKEENKYLLL